MIESCESGSVVDVVGQVWGIEGVLARRKKVERMEKDPAR
jgi:hypothetical protein